MSESSEFLKIKVVNKKHKAGAIGIRTVELPDGAKPVKDFGPIDKILEFKNGQEIIEIEVSIVDDDQWDPDKEFSVELYDPETS